MVCVVCIYRNNTVVLFLFRSRIKLVGFFFILWVWIMQFLFTLFFVCVFRSPPEWKKNTILVLKVCLCQCSVFMECLRVKHKRKKNQKNRNKTKIKKESQIKTTNHLKASPLIWYNVWTKQESLAEHTQPSSSAIVEIFLSYFLSGGNPRPNKFINSLLKCTALFKSNVIDI